MSERQYNEDRYNEMRVEGDDLKNAAICDEIADDSFTWNPGEAAYWRKKAIEMAEKHYGKENIANVFYYDKIVEDFLAKNSYKQAEKWNKKSKKIKIKEKGEYAFDVIANELTELRIDIFLKNYGMVPKCMEHIKEALKRNAESDPSVLHKIYLELAFIEGDSGVQEVRINDGYFVDHAIELAGELYGKDSLEVAEAYRRKGIGLRHARQGEKKNKEALEWFKKALLTARAKGTVGSDTVRWIFNNMEFCWDREMCELEGIRWTYRNVSREVAIDFMGIYSKPVRERIRKGFETITDMEEKEALEKAYTFYHMLETGQIDFTDMQNVGMVPDKPGLEGGFTDWKGNVGEVPADELEEQMVVDIKAGFLSNDEILERCREYMEEEYPEESDSITDDGLLKAIRMYRDKFRNTGNQEYFLKLDRAFNNLNNHGIVALHCTGYVQTDGFDDCNEVAARRYENGEKVIGCCFYTIQDLEHILLEESKSLYFSFGNYFDTPTAVEIGQMIVKELEAAGFTTQWTQRADTKIAITDFVWDKQYSENERKGR